MTDEEILAKCYLPCCDLPLWHAVELAAWRYACLHHLPLRAAEPIRNPGGFNNGLCYQEEGRIQLTIRERLANGTWSSVPDNGIDIVDTLAHELAHLADKATEMHSRRWRLEFDEIKEAMLQDGLHKEFDRLRNVVL